MARSSSSPDTLPVMTIPNNITENNSNFKLVTASWIVAMPLGSTTSCTNFCRAGTKDHSSDAVPFTACRTVPSSCKHTFLACAGPRGGRPWNLPQASAWSTLQQIEQKAEQRCAKRKQGQAARNHVHPEALELLRSEKKQAQSGAGGREEQPRAAQLVQLRLELHRTELVRCFSALSAVAALKVTVAEAQEHGIGKRCMKLVKMGGVPQSVQFLAGNLLRGWVEKERCRRRLAKNRAGGGQPAA